MHKVFSVLVIAIAFAACASGEPATDGARSVEGVIVDVESAGLNEVTSFELRHEGETETIYIIEGHDYGFPIGHLNEHLGSGDAVRVDGEVGADGNFYAESIEDV